MKRIIICALLLTLTILASGCQLKFTPEESFNEFANYIITDDLENANLLTIDNNLINDDYFDTDDDTDDDEFSSVLLSKAEYNIISVEKQDETATIRVSIKNEDMSNIMSQYFNFVFENAFSESTDEIDENAKLIELINASETQQVNEIDVKMQRVEKQWKIVIPSDDYSIMNAFTGGYIDYVNELRDTFESDE